MRRMDAYGRQCLFWREVKDGRAIVDGIIYEPAKSKIVCAATTPDKYNGFMGDEGTTYLHYTLYRTPDGHYFFQRHYTFGKFYAWLTGGNPKETHIAPLSPLEAREWCEQQGKLIDDLERPNSTNLVLHGSRVGHADR